MSEPEHHAFEVEAAEHGGRLDQALAARIPRYSRSALQAWIRDGHVQIDGRVATKASRTLRAGEQVRLEVPAAEPVRFAPEERPLDIVYEDADLLVVAKPAGLVVHPAAGHREGTLVNALLGRALALAPSEDPRKPGIVHRLDKDTSGCLLVAKTVAARAGLEQQFRERRIRKCYLALVHGAPAASGMVEASIGRDPRQRKRMKAAAPRGKAALSRYRVLERFEGASLLEVEIVTGRTHQIRVHLASIGHPVVGDALYGGRRPSAPPRLRAFPRQALHALSLRFRQPVTGAELCVRAELPIDMSTLLQELRGSAPPPREGDKNVLA